MGEGTSPCLGQHTGRHVHALTCESQQQAQYLASVALVLLCGRNGGGATDAALPDSVADLGLSLRLPWHGKVGEEEQVDESIDQLLSQGLCLFIFDHFRSCLGFV